MQSFKNMFSALYHFNKNLFWTVLNKANNLKTSLSVLGNCDVCFYYFMTMYEVKYNALTVKVIHTLSNTFDDYLLIITLEATVTFFNICCHGSIIFFCYITSDWNYYYVMWQGISTWVCGSMGLFSLFWLVVLVLWPIHFCLVLSYSLHELCLQKHCTQIIWKLVFLKSWWRLDQS